MRTVAFGGFRQCGERRRRRALLDSGEKGGQLRGCGRGLCCKAHLLALGPWRSRGVGPGDGEWSSHVNGECGARANGGIWGSD